MQKVLSTDLWKVVRHQALKVPQRKAAIAYVTRDLIGFRNGDVLVVDASTAAIASGETDARLLRTLQRKEVNLYHFAGLHAKVLLLGDVAVISSGNMSNSSAVGLVEAAVLTDHASTVSGVASLIEQLIYQAEKLDANQIDRLCRIKVIRRGRRGRPGAKPLLRTKLARLGNQTWLIGVHELVREPAPDEKKMIDLAEKTIRPTLNNPKAELDWIRWTGKSRFIRECREGDTLIQIWSLRQAKRPSAVLRAVPVLLKQKTRHWTRFYVLPNSGTHAEMSLGTFRRLLKSLGYSRRVSGGITHLLDPDMADAIIRRWKSLSR